MWIIQIVLAFCSGCVGTLTPYVVSTFQKHSLTALTTVISYLVAGLWKLPYAKLMNSWGRPQAFTIGVISTSVGLIMMAGCQDVQTYCAAQTFYYLGYNSISFSLTVFIADTSQLKNRGLFLGYASSPWLITTWLYGFAVESINKHNGIGFRWGFGIFCIIIPLVCSPLVALFFINEAKASKRGLLPARRNHGSRKAKLLYYCREFDAIGILILCTGLALFLLSFNLYTYQRGRWTDPLIICFVSIGFVLILTFGLWERFFAPITFVPWSLLGNRTVIFTFTMASSFYVGWYIWDTYFYSLLVVLFDQPIVHATYIANTYTMGSCFICVVYGLCLRYYGKLKWYSLLWGVPLTMLGVSLMIQIGRAHV